MKYKIKKYRNGNTVEWNTGPQFIPNPLPIEKPEDSPENIIDRSLGLMNPYEGFRSKVYDDKDPYRPYKGGKPKGTLTIGHGLTNPDIIKSFMNKEMDEQTSNNYQKEYINNDIIPALEKTSYYANLNPDQKASLISLVYNVGPTTFFKRSPKLQAALGANDWSEAVKHMNHGINQFKGLQQRRQAEQGTFMGDSVWAGNEYISKYVANPKYFKIGGKIRKHQIGQTVNWSTEPQGWKAYDEHKVKQNQIDFQNKVREANNPANNPLLNKPAPVANQDWRNQDTYSNWQSRQRAKQAKYEQSAPYKIGVSLKGGAQILSGSLGHLGMNIPFDVARSIGVKIPETMFSPTAFNDVDPNQSVGDFTKQIIGRGADVVSFYLGMGMIPGLVGGKALRNATPGMLTNNPVKSVRVSKRDAFDKWMEEGMVENNPNATQSDKEILKSFSPEYRKIQRIAKLRGTYLKNADGSKFEGDPREWIMLRSKNAKWLDKEGWYTGVPNKPLDNNPTKTMVDSFPNYEGTVWTSNQPDYGRMFSGNNGKIFKVHVGKDLKTGEFKTPDNLPSYWADLPLDKNTFKFSNNFTNNSRTTLYNPDGSKFKSNYYTPDKKSEYFKPFSDLYDKEKAKGFWIDIYKESSLRTKSGLKQITTDDFVNHSKNQGNQITRFYNILDGALETPAGKSYEIPVDELIIHPGTPRKSVLGNNGMFDIKNSNIYKSLAPILLGSSLYKNNK